MTPPTTLIAPRRGWGLLPDLGELWRDRGVLEALARRDLQVRYRQTALGAAWAFLQPAATMGAFSLFFGRFAGIASEGIPYPLFVACALAPWQYVSGSVSLGAMGLEEHRALLTKVYFPRLFLPLAPLVTHLADLGIALSIPVALLAIFRIHPGPTFLLLPLFLLLGLATAFGAALWLSALNAHYRDVRYAVPFLMQLWLFATPVVYPASVVPERWRPLLGLNPMASVVEGVRWCVAGGPAPGALILPSLAMTALLLVTGLAYFIRIERTLADVV